MKTEIVSVDALVVEGRALMVKGDDYYARAGAKFIEARAAAGCTPGKFTLLYRKALAAAGIAQNTECRAVRFAKNPALIEPWREDNCARAKEQTKKRHHSYGDAIGSKIKDLPKSDVSAGELHEATRGFVCMIGKAHDEGTKDDWRRAHERRTVAFAHFKLLLEQSNLPAMMKMTADEIIVLIRTL